MPSKELSTLFRSWAHRVRRPLKRTPFKKTVPLRLQACEDRIAPAVLPQPFITQTPSQVTFTNTTATNPAPELFHSVQVAVSPVDPLRQVAFGISGNGMVGIASVNGGQTWTEFYDTANTTNGFASRLRDFTVEEKNGPNEGTRLDAVTPSVAIDRNGLVYVAHVQRASGAAVTGAGVGAGVIVSDTYSFATGTTPAAILGAQDVVVYRWGANDDAAFNPFVAVNNNITWTDPVSGLTRSDASASKAVYIAFNTNATDTQENGDDFNPNVVFVAASTDQGATYSGPIRASEGYGVAATSDNGLKAAGPQIAFGGPQVEVGGVAPLAPINIVWTQVDPGPENALKVNPSKMWLDRSVPTPIGPNGLPLFVDVISPDFDNPATPGIIETTLPINNSATADVSALTTKTFTVDFDDANTNAGDFITDLNVRVLITHPSRDQLRIRLTNNLGTAVTLMENRVKTVDGAVRNNYGNGLTPGAAGGANLGFLNGVNGFTVFDDEAARPINDGNNDAPYIGSFRLEDGGNPDELRDLFDGKTVNELEGVWTLEFLDARGTGTDPQFVSKFDLVFTLGMPDGFGTNNSVTINAAPRGFADVYPTADPAAPGMGVGGFALAVDTSKVAQQLDGTPVAGLPNGSLYVAYTSLTKSSEVQNYDIRLLRFAPNSTGVFSDVKVSDDSLGDQFTEGNRAQFAPTAAVDPETGTLAVTWYDARFDANRTRVANYITTSIDGGQTFSSQTMQYVNIDANRPQDVSQQPFFNAPKVGTDAITGANFTVEPVPNNMAIATNPQGFGSRPSLFYLNGQLTAYWVGNQNAAETKTTKGAHLLRAAAVTGVGVRVVDNNPANMSSMGTVLTNRGPDGTPTLASFNVVFDRPVDRATFGADDIVLTFTDPNGVSSIIPVLNPISFGGNDTTFFVPLQNPAVDGRKVGTYVYRIGTAINDYIQRTPVGRTGIYTSTDTPINVPPLGTTGTATSSIVLPGLENGSTITDVNVTINMEHTFVGDLQITLIAPNGQRVLLFANRGGDGDNFQGTVFDDSAMLAIGDPMATAPYIGSFRPEQPLSLLNGLDTAGTWTLEIVDLFDQDSGRLLDWSLAFQPAADLPAQSRVGVDQNANGFAGEAADVFNLTKLNGAVIDRVPLSIPGPYVLGASRPGVGVAGFSGPHAPRDTLFLNSGASEIDVTFDRDMLAASFTPADVIRLTGPYGGIPGPFTVTPVNPVGGVTRVFRIGFPAQIVDGPYSFEFSSAVTSATGFELDNNKNAGIDVTLGTNSLTSTVQQATYGNAPGAVAIGANQAATMVLNVPDSFQIFQNPAISNLRIQVQLNISHANVPDLQADLIAPDGTRIRLFTNVGTVGQPPRSNFNNTIFQDNGTTNIQLGAAPFDLGTYVPQLPLGTLVNRDAQGQWRLEVTNNGAVTGTINSFSLSLPFAVTGSGVGEPVADRFQAGFRLFTQDPTNNATQTQYTPVGPATINGPGGNDGRLSAVTVDPSDPSGNTVYVAGASGGVWKTTNFLTLDAVGPVWIPLTDYGPTTSLNIGSIAVFPRNNDPSQTIVFALTGEGHAGSSGVGVLRSMDGGRTWKVLDSTNNADAGGNILPIADAGRDRRFVGTSGFKIVVDPKPTPTGEVIVYMAVSGGNGGIYRSINTGRSWTLIRGGQATDVILAAGSAPLNGPSQNLQILYGAFRGDGVYIATQAPAAASMSLMAGGIGNPNIRSIDPNTGKDVEVTVNAPTGTPNGAKGRIVLAAPFLENTDLENSFYQGWLYAFVATPSGQTDGFYLTKDFGRNWTKVNVPNFLVGTTTKVGNGTNDESRPQVDYFTLFPASGGGQGNYDIAMTVDPNNPYVVYLAGLGTQGPAQTGSIRIDVHTVSDAQALVYFDNSDPNAGVNIQKLTTTGGAVPRDNTKAVGQNFFNLSRDPAAPFVTGSTLLVDNTQNFVNDGADVKWMKFFGPLAGTADIHQIVSYIDPVTRKARLIYIGDQSIGTGVDRGDGTIVGSVGFTQMPSANRTGNLQVNQQYSGAAQPSTLAADIAFAMFYAGTQDNGSPRSRGDVLRTGNILWVGPAGDTSGVATDQTGSGTAYAYQWPCCGPQFGTDFFRVDFPASDNAFGVGRTTGLLRQGIDDPGADKGQWPLITQLVGYPAINPIDKNGAILSSAEGRLYRSVTLADPSVGANWFVAAEPNQLDGSIAKALAFGAPDPANPGQLNNFLYAGTNNGNVFVTNTGGAPWLNISNGIAGNGQVQDIEANPRRGSRDAFAVTSQGVFYNPNSLAGSPWQNITGNLFSLQKKIFGDTAEVTDTLGSLTSLAVDWRYAIPDNPANPSGPTHPVLYVGGNAGVYRSRDRGQTWSYFPNVAEDGAAEDGGYLPNVEVTDLDLSLGNIDPATGLPNQGLGGLNLLLVSTYGRGQFVIRLNTTIDQQFNVQFESGPVVTRLANPNPVGGPSSSLRVVFDQAVDPVTVGKNDFTLLDTAGNPVAITGVTAASATEFVVTFAGQSTPGFYSFTVGPDISDFAGNLMNQNQNKLNGEADDAFNRFVFLNGLANSLVVDGLPASVVAGQSATFTVSVVDQNGFNVAGFAGPVTFTSSDNGAKTMIPPGYNFTPADLGTKAFTVTFTTAGLQTITATADVPGLVNPGQDGTVVLSAPASQLFVAGHPTPVVAGTSNTFTVTAKDPFDNLAADYTGKVNITSSDPQAILPGQFTFTAADKGTVTLTAQLLTAGTQSISAADSVNVNLNGTQGGIVVTPAAPAKLAILGLPNPFNAGDFKPFTVQSQDAFGNLSPGFTGTVTFTSSDPNAALPADYMFAAGDAGSKTFQVQLRIPGLQTVTVLDTANVLTKATATTLVTPAAVATFAVTGHPSPVIAGTSNGFTVTAIAPDSSVAVGYLGTVRFTSTDIQAGLPAEYTFTVADNGSKAFAAALKTAGTQSITATETTSTITGTQGGIVVLPDAARTFTVTGFPSPTTAGVAGPVVVTARDQFGNVATGYTGTVTFASTDAQATLPANYTFAGADAGTKTFTATLRTAGTQAIGATDTVTPSIAGAQAGIVVTPAAAASYELKGHPSPVNAGAAATFTLTALDPFNNVATGYVGKVRFTSTDPQATLPADYTFTAADKGVRVFTDTLRTAGVQSIGGTDVANPAILGAQNGIVVLPGVAVGITVGGFPNPTTAGVPQTFVVTARDQFGNAAPSYGGTVRLSSSDKLAGLPADYTFTPADGGAKTFTGVLKTAGSQSISVVDLSVPAFASTQAGIAVVAASGVSLTLSSLPLSVVAGNNQQLLATVKDAFGNPATGYTGTLRFTSSDPQAGLPADYTFTAADKGQKLFTVSLKTAGTQSFAVNDTANNTIGAGQSNIQVFAAAISRFDVTGLPAAVLAGDPATFTLTARDAFGNLASGYGGFARFTSSDPRAVLPPDTAFTPADAGVRTFTARFGTPGVVSSVTAADVANPAVTGSAATTVQPNFDKDATLLGNQQFAVGTESRSSQPVRYFDSKGNFIFDSFPFQSDKVNGGGRVATADFTGDGRAEVIVGSSPGMASEVVVIDGFTEKRALSFAPFEASFTGGVYVTGGDITGDGIPELIVTPDQGGGPRVDVYDGATNAKVASFFGIDDPNFRGGARAAVGDINGDGFGDLLVAAGFRGGPRVAGFDGKQLAAGKFVKLFNDFFAFEPTLRNGVFIAAGDVDGDGKAEMIVGGGPGGGPRVQAFSGAGLLQNRQDVLFNFFAGNADNRGGVRITVKDLDGDKQADLITGDGAGAGSRVTAYYGATLIGPGPRPVGFEFDTFPGFTGGIFVG
jgi:subtilisin-like proprotein convertase family protein